MTNDNEPLVSIVVPVYNGDAFLSACIDSILNQTYSNFELIIVDDGSMDSSLNIAEMYGQKDKRILVVKKEHTNAGDSRNYGLDKAKGKYIAFLDCDDFFEEDLIELKVKQIEKDEADICASDADLYLNNQKRYEKGKLLKKYLIPSRIPFNIDFCPADIFLVIGTGPWMCLYRLDFIKKYGLRYQSIERANDVYFSNMAFALADKITIVDKVLIHHRVELTTNLQSGMKETPDACIDANLATKEGLIKYGLYEKAFSAQVKYSYYYICSVAERLSQNDEKEILFKRIKEGALEKLDIPRYYISTLETQINNPDMFTVGSRRGLLLDVKRILDLGITNDSIAIMRRYYDTLKHIDNKYQQIEYAKTFFPFESVRANSRVILYGKGDYGQQYLNQIEVTKWCNIVGFCDREAGTFVENYKVFSIEELKTINYDYLVISIYNPVIAEEIQKELENNGVDKNKIVYFRHNREIKE